MNTLTKILKLHYVPLGGMDATLAKWIVMIVLCTRLILALVDLAVFSLGGIIVVPFLLVIMMSFISQMSSLKIKSLNNQENEHNTI